MDPVTHCVRCGAQFRLLRAEGLCTRCMLESGLRAPLGEAEQTDDPGFREPYEPDTRWFGDYELLEEIARGGMGVIYRARQPRLERVVALKMILAGQFATKDLIQRFRGEVTAAALLQHPNIVAIYDVGVHDGQHYFSMEYVEGPNLSQLVGNRPLPPAKAARYVRIIAEAIQHAHQQGILHRDLKPSNVLVDAGDQPRITDFGLAKRLDGDSSITATGQILGSPNFMPPEQAGSRHGKVGRQSDVYGLGAILYHLLTARPPFQAESFESVIHQLLNHEPISPRLLNSSVPRDLETVCLKCLEKEPSRRYQSARELADELGRFLRGESILARPITRAESAWKWCRRNPALAGAGTALVLVFILGFAGTAWQWRQAEKSAKSEAAQRLQLDQSLYDADMSRVQDAWDGLDLGLVLAKLKDHLPGPDKRDRRGFEWYYFWKLCEGDPHTTLRGHDQTVDCLAFSPDGRLLATGAVGTPVQVWESATGKRIRQLPELNVVSLAFAPDGRSLGVGGRDQLAVYDLETGREVFKRPKALEKFCVAFPRVGTLLAIGTRGGRATLDGGSAELVDYSTGESKKVFTECGGHIVVSRDGDLLLTGTWDGFVTVWDLPGGQFVRKLKTGRIQAMSLSPDGRLLATCYWSNEVKLWDVGTGILAGSLTNNPTRVWSLAFSRDGKSLLTGCADQTVRLWDMATLQQVDQLQGHGGEVMSVAFSSDDHTIASGAKDRTAMLWNIPPARVLTTVSNFFSRPIFSPDSRLVAAATEDDKVAVWDLATLQVKAEFAGASAAVAFSKDGKNLLTRGTNYFLRTYDLATRAIVETVQRGPVEDVSSYAVLSPDGRTLATGSTNGTLMVSDARSGAVRASTPLAGISLVFRIVFSPDGERMAIAGRQSESDTNGPSVKILEVATAKLLAAPTGHSDMVLATVFSPDGKILATCSADDSVRLWDTATWREIPPSLGHKEYVSAIAFSHDGKSFASASHDGVMKLWNLATRRELASLKIDDYGFDICFSPDSHTLVGWNGSSLRVWRAPVVDVSPP